MGDVQRTLDGVWRIESARLIAASMTGNARERAVLLDRMAACSPRNGS